MIPPPKVVYPFLPNQQPSGPVYYPFAERTPPSDAVFPFAQRTPPSDAVYPFACMNSLVQRYLPTTVSPTTGEVYPFAYMIAAEQNNPALRSLAAPPSQRHQLSRSLALSPNTTAYSSPGMGTLHESTAPSYPTTAAESNTAAWGPRLSLLESVAPLFPSMAEAPHSSFPTMAEAPYLRDPQPPLLTDLERQTRQHLEPSLLNVLPNTFSPQYPLHHNFSVIEQPYFMFLYVRDSLLGESLRVPLTEQLRFYNQQIHAVDGFILQAADFFKPVSKEKSGKIAIPIPEIDPYKPPELPRPKSIPNIPSPLGKRSGPSIVRGFGSLPQMGVEVIAGPDDPETPRPKVSPFFPIPLPQGVQDGPPLKGYGRGTVELWAYWYFLVVGTGAPVPFAIRSDPYYQLVLQSRLIPEIDESVKALIQGEVYVADVTQSSPRPKSIRVYPPNKPPYSVGSPKGYNPIPFDAHDERALDWHVSLELSANSFLSTDMVARNSSNSPSPQLSTYSFATNKNNTYLVTYVDYIRVDNGNGAAFANLLSTPRIWL